MVLNIYKENLLTLLLRTQNIVEKRNTMPILVNILLDAQEMDLNVFATNLEVSVTDKVPAEIIQPGKATVNAKSLLEIVRELDDGLIELKKQENNWLTITQGYSVFNIVGIHPDEYPVFPTFTTDEFIKIHSQVFSEMIEKTIFSTSNDETRYHLNGVFFEKENNGEKTSYQMVATDSHRLSLIRKEQEAVTDSTIANGTGVIIPRKGLHEIRKLIDSVDEEIEVAIEGSQLIVRHQSTLLMIRLIEGKYPNYKSLIPKDMVETLQVSREKLYSSLKRVSLLSNQKSKGVTFSLSDNQMQITSNNPELGDAKEVLEVSYKGKDIKIGFNARFILEVLNSMEEDTVEFELKDQLSPALVKPQNNSEYTCVIMPLRI